jgi:hypothetical protein
MPMKALAEIPTPAIVQGLAPVAPGQGRAQGLAPVAPGQGRAQGLAPVAPGQGRAQGLAPVAPGQGRARAVKATPGTLVLGLIPQVGLGHKIINSLRLTVF